MMKLRYHADSSTFFDKDGKLFPNPAQTLEELETVVNALAELDTFGTVLRAKGIVAMNDGSLKQFDLVPGEAEIRDGKPDYTGRICVIGTDLKEDELAKAFHI